MGVVKKEVGDGDSVGKKGAKASKAKTTSDGVRDDKESLESGPAKPSALDDDLSAAAGEKLKLDGQGDAAKQPLKKSKSKTKLTTASGDSAQPTTTAKGKSGKGEGQTKQDTIKEYEETGKTSGDDAMDVDTAATKGGKKGGGGGGKKAGANKKKTASTASADKETPPTEAVPELTTTEKSETLGSPGRSSPKAGASETTEEKVESGSEDKVQSSPEKDTKAAPAGGKGKKAGSEKVAGKKGGKKASAKDANPASEEDAASSGATEEAPTKTLKPSRSAKNLKRAKENN